MHFKRINMGGGPCPAMVIDAQISTCINLRDALISWKCKRQDKVSKSSTEAKYRFMSAACSEILWLRGLLSSLDLGFPQHLPTPLRANNTNAIQITETPIFHDQTKHIEVDCHFIRVY